MKSAFIHNLSKFVSTLCSYLFVIFFISALCVGTASAQSVKKNAGLLQAPVVVSAPTKRIALIIGNHQYQRLSKLPNAGRDADAMAVAVKAAGFSPTIAKDLSYTAMVEVVAQFLKTINKGDEVVVFFSGHGVQIPKQGGYLLPIDVSTTSASKVDKTAYELETLMAEVAEANPAFSLFIVDACRDNPFATKGVGTGFTNPEAAQGQIVLFAASRNQQALEKLSDDDKDPNGVFTREFIKRMKTPGLEISDLMKEVQNSVEILADKVGHKQRPAIVNEARGNFYFFGPTTVKVNASNASAPDFIEQARRPMLPGQVIKDCAECPEMIIVPAGNFLMGSPINEIERSIVEGPQRNVSLKSFAIGKTEVTQGQWKAIMGSNPSGFKACGDNCPVEQVSLFEIQDFIQKLNIKTGQAYRLPSESEWEYAARAGTRTAFHTGNTITPEQSNFDGNATYNGSIKGIDRGKTTPVGSFSPNAFGLHDMHGNVWERVQDCFERNYGKQPIDGTAYDSKCYDRVRAD